MSSMKLVALILAMIMVATGACSPSDAPNPEPLVTKEALPTDFLGVRIGTPFTAEPCSLNPTDQAPAVCASPTGGETIRVDKRPFGMAEDLYLTEDATGNVEQIIATIEAGHDGSIVRNMIEKYGAPDLIREDGEHHWIGEKVSVLYKPATKYQEGMVVVASRKFLDRQRHAKEEAQSRKL